jgi:diguanylate cyclase
VSDVRLHPTALKEENDYLREELQRRDEEILLLKRKNRELYELAYKDAVTGLSSRIHLEEVFESVEAKLEPLCLVMIDLDDFKSINDSFGHDTGDMVLHRLGAILETVSHREHDVRARYGGEEFVVVLRSCNTEGAEHYVGRLLCRIREDLKFRLEDGRQVSATASIGIAERLEGESMNALLRRADQALYDAKRDGKDRVVVATKVNTK